MELIQVPSNTLLLPKDFPGLKNFFKKFKNFQGPEGTLIIHSFIHQRTDSKLFAGTPNNVK